MAHQVMVLLGWLNDKSSNLRDTHVEVNRQLPPVSCLLTSTHIQWQLCMHAHLRMSMPPTHKYTYIHTNKINNYSKN